MDVILRFQWQMYSGKQMIISVSILCEGRLKQGIFRFNLLNMSPMDIYSLFQNI